VEHPEPLGGHLHAEEINAGSIAPWSREAYHKPELHRVSCNPKDDWYRYCRCFSRKRSWPIGGRCYDGHLATNEIFDKALSECKADKSWNTVEIADCGHVAMLDIPQQLTELLIKAA
jgi:hypothetical protein